mmetsp:Transcript_39291/g.99588  ORF Transcript_39291/g.99588 Transcript_39291/m.99588 type:complete len:204 (+) Transcript_39291:998-1609(+)
MPFPLPLFFAPLPAAPCSTSSIFSSSPCASAAFFFASLRFCFPSSPSVSRASLLSFSFLRCFFLSLSAAPSSAPSTADFSFFRFLPDASVAGGASCWPSERSAMCSSPMSNARSAVLERRKRPHSLRSCSSVPGDASPSAAAPATSSAALSTTCFRACGPVPGPLVLGFLYGSFDGDSYEPELFCRAPEGSGRLTPVAALQTA